MSALLLVYRADTGQTVNVPFVLPGGEMPDLIRAIADHILAHDLGESFWETIAVERLGEILRLRVAVADALRTAERTIPAAVAAP